ncbi:TPM domain-containing protein [Microbacterium album]|uniref:Membrane protein n=1 Tax=Microbacterium album TaxID=2053191 RepID=A0A917IFD5_9MICO|nr:TPM domain-containing protein [Microbacterium album]GGH47763.1 membrane protein [Microbacterium album]
MRARAGAGGRRIVALVAAVTMAASAVLAGTAPAFAEDPVELRPGFVHDAVDALTPAEEEAAQERLDRLSAETGHDLWVVFVDRFTNPEAANEWADETAIRNGLADDQYLLAVATEGRTYFLSSSSAGPVSDAQVGEIEQSLEPHLRAEDWAGAIDAAAAGFEAVAAPGTGEPGGGGAGSAGWTIVLLVVAVLAVVAVWIVVARRRSRAPAAKGTSEPQVPTEELARRASSALVATDDAVRASEQELGFAVAQFGADATSEFEQALQTAKAELAQAFELKQKLDDHEKDTEEEIRAWNAEIVRLCESASETLERKHAAFDELRRIEQDASAALVAAQQRRGAAEGTAERAGAALAELADRYAPAALDTVADNPAQARTRLEFADEQLARAQELVATGQSGEAAVAIRAAEQATAQAALLEQAVTDLAATLADAERQANELLADLERDLVRARALPASPEVAGVVSAAERAVAQARENLSGTARRPRVLLASLEQANAQLDQVVGNAERTQHMLAQTLLQARSHLTAAEEYIAARRGAVGAQARTRLAEAGAELSRAEALGAADPAQALPRAQRALQLAAQASELARSDVSSADWGTMLGGGAGGGRRGGGMTESIVGGILGGLISSSLNSGGRSSGGRSSGWGGSSWSGGGRSSSGRSGGSWGGGRSTRSGGGSFGRSGGGRGGRRGGGRF